MIGILVREEHVPVQEEDVLRLVGGPVVGSALSGCGRKFAQDIKQVLLLMKHAAQHCLIVKVEKRAIVAVPVGVAVVGVVEVVGVELPIDLPSAPQSMDPQALCIQVFLRTPRKHTLLLLPILMVTPAR